MRKVAFLAMTAVLALTTVGYGFAKWSSTVDANVIVNTGSVQIGIRDVGTNDDGTNDGVPDYGIVPVGSGLPNAGNLGADPQWGAGLNGEKKDVAKKVSENTGTIVGSINGINYYDSIKETITNGYPYYGPTTDIEIANLGTIPVKLETLNHVWTVESVINDEYYDIVGWTITYPDGTVTSGAGTDNLLATLQKTQLHAKDVLKVSMQEGIRQTAKSDSTQITPQNASGSETITVTASQWNEVN